jgi:hypothetical protein
MDAGERPTVMPCRHFSFSWLGAVLPECCPNSGGKSPSRQHNMRVCRETEETGATGLEPATSGVTGRRSNQLNYAPGDAPL